MNRLPLERRSQVIRALVEGNSIRSTTRMTGVAKNTIVKLLADVGQACFAYQDHALRGLTCKLLQVDEIWTYVYAKERNVPTDRRGEWGVGDVWTYCAIDADTKLVPCWMLGYRDGENVSRFIRDLASRLTNRVQLTTDGLRAYLSAVEDGFGENIDYAMLVKLYGPDPAGAARYSPARCNGAKHTSIIGNPEREHISTSYVERQNLTMRMSMRRFTRLTNAFSKKVENLEYAVALHYMHYNFARRHQTLRVSPAMEAGIAKHLWTVEEIAQN